MQNTKSRIFHQLEIGLASPKEIKSWAERYLPNGEIVGEVTSWETVNYKTLKPEPNGLFCQKIFGPVVDYTCACGKKAGKLISGTTSTDNSWSHLNVCPKCGVERTSSDVRRIRMGYIHLKQPVAHTLYASQKPSPLALCLNWPNKKFQAVLYGTEFSHTNTKFSYLADDSFNAYAVSWQQLQLNEKFTRQLTKVPKLFQKSNNTKQKIFQSYYNKHPISFPMGLSGISYESTWKDVEALQYFLIYLWEQPNKIDKVIPHYFQIHQLTKKTEDLHMQFFPIQTGAGVFQKILSYSDLIGIQRQLALDIQETTIAIKFLTNKIKISETLKSLKIQKQVKKYKKEKARFYELQKKLLRRLQYFRDFYRAKIQPEWMTLSCLPVLPPGIRPITSIRGQLVVSDLNSLYRRVLTRNRRLESSTRFGIFDTALSGSWAAWCYNLRQVQESVDSLLKTGKIESGKTTKSLLDALKGKRGRFRQHLLGKRVDYSGRSVIVVGPKLKIYECGLPKKMAVELFQPFLIQQLRNKGIAFTTTGAKALILERKPIIWTLLREILQSHPILLNRAPTLHRLGIQAFLPKLVDGKAILLHPLVCPAFNADFDGDQMAVHIPLSPAARAEALNLVLASNHLLSPALGQPLLLPTQDMVLGCYYLTISKEKQEKHSFVRNRFLYNQFRRKNLFLTKSQKIYLNFKDVIQDYEMNILDLHMPIWVSWKKKVQNFVNEHQRNNLIEIRITKLGNLEHFYFDKYKKYCKVQTLNSFKSTTSFIRTTPGRILFHNLRMKSFRKK